MNKSIPKVALITGANRGRGSEIARQLGRSGAVVIGAGTAPFSMGIQS
jgi:NAD(P)-dependent dehydrogenase (short-subunit alcohol dehydrogenase family)